jgi:undecaprenyl-diphosphatase
MTWLQALVLGILQGLTEFLPVSSSGHLAIVEHLWSMPESARVALTAVLHIGTALALVVYFAPRLGSVARAAFGRASEVRSESRRTIACIALGSVPAAIVGLFFADAVDAAFSSPTLIGSMLIVTGGLLFATRFARERSVRVVWLTAAIIGLAQAAAILPGISRSGATIAVAVLVGIGREDAFEFSFLLSVPVVFGAAIKELVGLDWALVGPGPVVLGILVAFGAGLGALGLLRRAVLGRRLHWFAYYCWLAGLLVLVLVR